MSLRTAYIADGSRPGFASGRVVTLDPSIVIDSYDPTEPPLWLCDHCQSRNHVTAQLGAEDGYTTLCAVCLQNALDGIAYSLANPKAAEGA